MWTSDEAGGEAVSGARDSRYKRLKGPSPLWKFPDICLFSLKIMKNDVLDFIIAQTKQNIEFLASQGALLPDEKLQIIQKLDIAKSNQVLGAQTIGDSTNESPTTKENHSITGPQTITEKTCSPPPGPPPSNGFLYRARAIWGYNEDNRVCYPLTAA